jgi:hypothetical protein
MTNEQLILETTRRQQAVLLSAFRALDKDLAPVNVAPMSMSDCHKIIDAINALYRTLEEVLYSESYTSYLTRYENGEPLFQ